MSDISHWIGKSQSQEQIIDLATANKMAATIDGFISGWQAETLEQNSPLPRLWHWAWFNDVKPNAELGRDGHPAKGGFLPPVKLPRRMWAGGRLEFFSPIPIGATAQKKSTILDIKEKSGKTGPLCFVTVRHVISVDGCNCVIEEHDIVYRDDPKRVVGELNASSQSAQPVCDQKFTPNSTLLFRYSALTFNGHRIHYDQTYAREVEFYPDLVFHGPLNATFMMQLAQVHARGRKISHYSFRALAPLYVDQPVYLQHKDVDDGIEITALNPANEIAMKATAIFSA